MRVVSAYAESENETIAMTSGPRGGKRDGVLLLVLELPLLSQCGLQTGKQGPA